MNRGIIVIRDAFCREFCDAVANTPTSFINAQVGPGTEINEDSTARRSQVSFFDGYFQNPELFEVVLPFIHKVNQEHFKFELFNVEQLQLTKYDHANQGFYTPHEDTDEPNELGLIRKLSFTIQLTDPTKYQGGRLVFPDIPDYDPSTTLEQGTAIVFPSYVVHGVDPVTSGVRYSLVGWARGPQCR